MGGPPGSRLRLGFPMNDLMVCCTTLHACARVGRLPVASPRMVHHRQVSLDAFEMHAPASRRVRETAAHTDTHSPQHTRTHAHMHCGVPHRPVQDLAHGMASRDS